MSSQANMEHHGNARSILHLDMDCFYVSVERLQDPSLIGKAVAVGGSPDGRGVISSASYEARKFGVRSAMPTSRALQLCPHLVLVNGGFSHYGEYSRQIHDILLEFTPLVQMASQDEAYLDLTGTERLWGNALKAAEQIRRRISDQLKLPCSIGLGSNKLIAKVASALCKPAALLYVPHGSEEAFLAPLPIRKLPGIGPKAAEALARYRIERIGDIARLDRAAATRIFGNHAADMIRRAQGAANDEVRPGELPKSIGAEDTFREDSGDPVYIGSVLGFLSEKVAHRLRKKQARAMTITLKYRYSNFETHTSARTLVNPTSDETTILSNARELLHEKWDRSRPIRLVGITCGRLVFDHFQADLFEEQVDEKRTRLHDALDSMRERHGFGIVRRGSSGGVEN